MEPTFAALALCDRAFQFLVERGQVSQEELLAYVYGGATPAPLRLKLAAPLLADARLERRSDETWCVRGTASRPASAASTFTALALAATGPSPRRARLVRIVALRVDGDQVVEHFDVLLNPQAHVPKYVLERIGVEREVLNEQPVFADVFDALVRFFGQRSVLAQDARVTWGFLETEARRLEQIVVEPDLLDVNQLSSQRLPLKGKPSLAAVAAHLGIPTVDLRHPDEEARVLALVGTRLLATGTLTSDAGRQARVLRRGATARALPEEPGVYVLRDADRTALYIGKAKRLRSRMAAYVHRPLGATRRLEGLVAAVEAVDTTQCDTDLEALVLEDREIRRLQPRFNTVRQQRRPRYWIKMPVQRISARGRVPALPRLELSFGPGDGDGEFVGPFRNEAVAETARRLARQVFDLDALRGSPEYLQRLGQAWQFLNGDSTAAQTSVLRSTVLLRKIAAFNVQELLLPADPRTSRYVVIRPSASGVEAFLLDRAILHSWSVLRDDDVQQFSLTLLQDGVPRTSANDVEVVLRWFGAQRSSARLIHLSDDPLLAADAIQVAALDLLEARASRDEDTFDPFV